MKGVSWSAFGWSVLLAAAPAQAQVASQSEAADDDIVVTGLVRAPLQEPGRTGSRLGLTPLETPASVASINATTIHARGDLDLNGAVTRSVGVTTSANPGNGGTALVMRGFGGQGSVLQLVDGVRLFPVAGTITFPTDPWNVDRIEVLNGPASVLYGQGALGGAINIVTKAPSTERTEAAVEAGYGSQQSWRIAAGIGGPIAPALSYRVDASYRQSDGWVDRGDSDSLALSGALRFAPSDAFSLTLRHDHGLQHPMDYFGTPLIAGKLVDANQRRNYNVADGELRYLDNRTSLVADWTLAEGVTLSNAAYRLTSKRLFKNLESYFWNGASGTIDRMDNLGIAHDQEQLGNQASLKISKPIGGMGNDFVIGFDVNRIRLTYSHDFGSAPQFDTVNPYSFNPGLFYDTQGIAPRYRTRTNEWSVFAEDRLKLTEQLSLVAGVRHERDAVRRVNINYTPAGTTETNAFPGGRTQRVFNNTTWRVGGVYQPTPDVSLYGQYTTGVDPLGTLTTYTTSASQFAFTNARGNQVEGGVKASFLGGRGSATLAGYRIVKQGLAAQRTPTSPIEQVGQRSSQGVEASVAMQLGKSFGFDANVSLLDARFDDFISGGTNYNGKTPANTPETAGNFSVYWRPVSARVRVNANLRYVGPTFSDNANTYRIPGYAVADAGISIGLSDGIWLTGRVYNLFDKAYATTSYNDEQWLLGRPRSFDIALSARF
ncbi:MAG: TonB-dependent receptor [Sphingomonas sp.]|uniref:TonB-dependent receptor n=1 Tax=Sphingomonas sp. TaxID=28214 RepID=UPI0025E63365|nr:TonB-dependent receptor [Sphingomonas sp.]MBX3563548.1 TonB-dependent receptor [Sphingomonas sp.]